MDQALFSAAAINTSCLRYQASIFFAHLIYTYYCMHRHHFALPSPPLRFLKIPTATNLGPAETSPVRSTPKQQQQFHASDDPWRV